MTPSEASIWQDIYVGLITSAIAATLGYTATHLLRRYRLRHLRHLQSDTKRVKIIVPTMLRATFPKGHFSEHARIPNNIPLMPMPEGKGLAYLVSAIRDAIADVDVELVVSKDFVDDGVTPFVSIGGPSVNDISGQLLSLRVPDFSIRYPEHTASFGSLTMSPSIVDDVLQEDYGFLFQGQSRLGTHCVVVCGVWATGTELACLAYAGRFPNANTAKARKHLMRWSSVFLVLKSTVQNYQVGETRLVAARNLTQANGGMAGH